MHIHFVLSPIIYSVSIASVVPCLENIIVHREVAFDAKRFGFSPVLSVEKII